MFYFLGLKGIRVLSVGLRARPVGRVKPVRLGYVGNSTSHQVRASRQ